MWRGDAHLHLDQQGFKVLGVPFGHPAYVKRFLEEKIADHSVLLDPIPAVPDTQSAWLLLSFLRCSPIQFLLARSQPVGDRRIRSSPRPWCVAVFVQDSVHSSKLRCRRSGQVATVGEGGLELWSAQRTQPAAHWASWADAIKMVKDRFPAVAELIVSALEEGLEVVDPRLECTIALPGHIWRRGEPQVWQKKKRIRVSHTRVGNSRPLRQLSDTT